MKTKIYSENVQAIVFIFMLMLSSCKRELAMDPPDAASTTRLINSGLLMNTNEQSLLNITGTLVREEWTNVSGNDVRDIPVVQKPNSTGEVGSSEGPLNHAFNYGDRFSGYITPPVSGKYIFWIAGDDAGELWLSNSTETSGKKKIASFLSWTNYREWTKFASQRSEEITLKAGQPYYMEILHKQGGGGDHISVRWTLPDQTVEEPIPGSRLASKLNTSSSTGTISREVWDNIIGNDIRDIPLSASPGLTDELTVLEGKVNAKYNYGERIRGYLNPPVTGNYTFWVAGDDAVELWLSASEDPAKKVRIAYTLSWTNFREWNKFGNQKSAQLSLQAGHKYYVEVLHKQGGGGDNLSVQWMLPDQSVETPIPSSRLSPYTENLIETGYTASPPIYLEGAHDLTISGKSINGGTTAAITLINCYNLHITQNKFANSADVGIHLLNCRNITIDNNYFTNVSSGVYAEQIRGGGIIVNDNQF